jgi:DNA (cytosine-5)-methyltransferase 1
VAAGGAAVRSLDAVTEVLDAMGQGRDVRHRVSVEDDRDLLVCEPLRWALSLRPEWMACEQVPAVLPVWERIATVLASCGYSTWTGVLNARDYGVPQDRRRAILIASRTREVTRPAESGATVRPCDVLPWAASDRVGFPRRNDRDDGGEYRARDLRAAAEPVFTLTSKSRSWSRFTEAGERLPLELDEATRLQGFPAGYPFAAAGSRSQAFERLADTIPPPLAAAVLGQVVDPSA